MEDNSPLYLAHQNERRAESHIHFKRFDEAVQCHQKASEWIQQAMLLTKAANALESLKLQQEHNLKQKDIIRVKKIQFEYQKELFCKKKKMALEEKRSKHPHQKDQDLQWAILRTMEEADSLLGTLAKREEVAEEGCGVGLGQQAPLGLKRPKDDQAVMEELRTVNAQLRALVTQLLAQLDASEREADMLRTRLKVYETDSLPDLAPLEMPNFDFSTE